jgi:hypothetical protein
LLNEGFTVAECEQIRRLERAQVLDHVLQAHDRDLPIQAEWFLSPAQLASLARVIGSGPVRAIRPLLRQLPPEIGYEHVQLYLCCR